MKDKIIAAIESYLVQETHLSSKHGETFVQFMHPIKIGYNRAEYCQEISAEIAEKITEVMQPKQMPSSGDPMFDLWKHMSGEHGLTLLETELFDIVELAKRVLEKDRKTGWEDAPSWAKWRTVDEDGLISFWEKEPILYGRMWLEGGREKCIPSPDFKQSKTQRPK